LSNKVHVKKGDTVVLLTGEGKKQERRQSFRGKYQGRNCYCWRNEYCKEASKTQITISAGRYN